MNNSSYDPMKNLFLKINCLSKGIKMLISIQVECLVCYVEKMIFE